MGSVAVVPVPGRATGRPVITVGTLPVGGTLTPPKGAVTGSVTVGCGPAVVDGGMSGVVDGATTIGVGTGAAL
jgi:hypothetical protein